MGKWHVCFMSFNMATSTSCSTCATHCKPQTKKTGDIIAATLVFVCTGHWNFQLWPQGLHSGFTQTRLYVHV